MINIMEANLNDISRIAKLFDDYRIFYKQQSDVTGAKDFYLTGFQIMNRSFFMLNQQEM